MTPDERDYVTDIVMDKLERGEPIAADALTAIRRANLPRLPLSCVSCPKQAAAHPSCANAADVGTY